MTETGSTNADLLAAALAGEPEGAVLVTDHQTAGRGRQARTWIDEPGNSMLMSVLLRPPAAVAGLVPLISGLAVTDGLGQLLGEEPGLGADRAVALKWPNDVISPRLGERKLCGILAEATTVGAGAEGGAPGRLVVVSGMGMNLRWTSPPPDEIAQRAATVEELAGRPVERWDVLAAYRGHCVTIGRRVRMQTATGVVEGTVAAVADSGALVLDTADGRLELTAGDAHHLT